MSVNQSVISQAAEVLRLGGLVAFPTETVYGLGADAAQASAVAQIYRMKGRPTYHPLIVHVRDLAQARWWGDFSHTACQLAEAFWPGPLTLVVPRRAAVPAFACGETPKTRQSQNSTSIAPTIALRCPIHPVAQALLDRFTQMGGRGVAAPSANRFGRISPTTAQHVREEFGSQSCVVLDGGACSIGVESTILSLVEGLRVLRLGGLPVETLVQALGVSSRDLLSASGEVHPAAPGTLPAHYAPHTSLQLLDGGSLQQRIACGGRFAVWSFTEPLCWESRREGRWVAMPQDEAQAAKQLYSTLRDFDQAGCDAILVEWPPSSWELLWDRLRRAAHGSGIGAS